MKVPFIPAEAPFSDDQRAWLAGFLAGFHSRTAMSSAGAVASGAEGKPALPLDILYGTQTGNAEAVAEQAAELASANGMAPRVQELDAVDMDMLAGMQQIIVVISTYGEGEMPDNAQLFWDALSATTAPRLEALQFGVLALGDTSYDQFCQAGKLIDTRLEQLGARRLTDRIDCDIDFEDPSSEWLGTTLGTLKSADGDGMAPVSVQTSTAKKKTGWSRKKPYPSQVVENRLLSGVKSAKEIRHFAFSLGDSGLTYEAGDALGVMPVNQPSLVTALLDRLGADADALIDGHDAPLGQLLTSHYEIRTPSRDLIMAVEGKAQHDEFSHVVSHQDKEALEAFLWGRDSLDLLNLNADLKIDPAEFISLLKPLQHRAYSISSSPHAHPGEVHLTVAAVRWHASGRDHMGVASTYLSDHCTDGDLAPIFMSPNKSFRVPVDDTKPMIMVGPGTGIAPFRAFLEERRERGATGKNWLFFGDQHRESDFIYEDEMSAMSHDGILSRLDLAFSRDQDEKIYVQTRMRENGKALYAWLEEGGYFYVCGDATRMAKDVDAALFEIVKLEGGLTEEKATEYIAQLKREKRYLRDVY
ncbi:MAG: sulfite reductase flavoprotein subunit alpha [Pseudomonadota bacterium]